MAELQGRLKGPGDAQTKVTKIEGDLHVVMGILSGGILCPHCEEKVMGKLEKAKLLDDY